MFNLRFKCTVISSWHMVLHAVPKANKMMPTRTAIQRKKDLYMPSGLLTT